MGFGYKGDTGHYHSLGENLPTLKSTFSYNERTGYFGTVGTDLRGKPGKNPHVREIHSQNPATTAKTFYDAVTYGGLEKKLVNGEGLMTIMKDGTVITYREVSHSANHSPAVDINISNSNNAGGVSRQKIHFVKSAG